MIDKNILELNFFPVVDISKNIIRCADELNSGTIYTYFHIRSGEGCDILAVSNDQIDDALATLIFDACPKNLDAGFHKIPFISENHKFTHLIIADNRYFSDLNGRMEKEKKNCLIAIPIFNYEFADFEAPEDFYELRRNIVLSNNWKRDPAPRIKFRYDNVKTGAGTGDGYVFAKLEGVFRDIQGMEGSEDSFAEIINFRGDVLELLPAADGQFSVIYNRDDTKITTVPLSEVSVLVQSFVSI